MNSIELFRVAYAMGASKNSEAKSAIETMICKYLQLEGGVEEEEKLKHDMLVKKDKLDLLRRKVKAHEDRLGELKEFKADTFEKLYYRFIAEGKFDGLNEIDKTALYNKMESNFQELRSLESYISGTAPFQLNSTEDIYLSAKRAYDSFKNNELPKSYNESWNVLFQSIVNLMPPAEQKPIQAPAEQRDSKGRFLKKEVANHG